MTWNLSNVILAFGNAFFIPEINPMLISHVISVISSLFPFLLSKKFLNSAMLDDFLPSAIYKTFEVSKSINTVI